MTERAIDNMQLTCIRVWYNYRLYMVEAVCELVENGKELQWPWIDGAPGFFFDGFDGWEEHKGEMFEMIQEKIGQVEGIEEYLKLDESFVLESERRKGSDT